MNPVLLFALCLIVVFFTTTTLRAQDPDAPIWGLYASGVGERLKVGMDPCWITYTVALTTDPTVVANLGYGTMGRIVAGVTWAEATAQQRRFGRYFDDEPDGIFKLTSCEVPPPDLSCPWPSTYGMIHWDAGYYGSKTKTLSGDLIQENGRWQYRGTWGRTNSARAGTVVFTFESPTSFSGYWIEGTSGKKTKWSGSGRCQ